MKLTSLLRFGLAAAAISVFLVACSSGDDDSAPPTAADGAATTEALVPDGGPTIKLGFSAWPGWFPWQVAEEMGFFKKAGVDVELVWFEGYLDSINAFAAGQLDANSQTLNDTLLSVAAGSDQRIVLVNDNSTGNDQIIADASINSVQDLVGKKVGVEAGVVDHFLLAQGLQKAGLTLDDVDIVNLETGAAAALSPPVSWTPSASSPRSPASGPRRAKAPTSSLAPRTSPARSPTTSPLVVTWSTNRPEAVQRIINAWYMTLDYIKNNPDEAIAIMAKRAGVSVDEYKELRRRHNPLQHRKHRRGFYPRRRLHASRLCRQADRRFPARAPASSTAPSTSKVLDPQFIKAYADTMP